jgi:murein DD-endopeptidase MepM/ murein hydrolase activator NlpD
MRLVQAGLVLALGAAWCGLCQFIALPNLVVTAIVPQLPFGGAELAAWQLGAPLDSDDLTAGATRVPHSGYADENAGPPAGLPLRPPVFKWGEAYARPLLGCRFRDPNYVTHSGADFPLDEGQGVSTTLAGQVVWAGANGPWGLLVVVENGGYQVWFAHLSGVSVAVGQVLGWGAPVGLSGDSGRSSGLHLHYGVKAFIGPDDAFGAWQDPEGYFDLAAVIVWGCGR